MRVEDISPTGNNTTLKKPFSLQSTGGRGLCIAGSRDGKRLYIGNNAGVWRSNDGGKNWKHMERPQPKAGTVAVPGALWSLNVYDLTVAKDPNVVLACTNYDIRKPAQNGIYRSKDGGVNWKLVQAFPATGQIVNAPENPDILFAAVGTAIVKSVNAGAAWSNLTLPLGDGQVWHVAAAAPATAGQENTRRLYALGTQMLTSKDGGATWTPDASNTVSGSQPFDAMLPSTRLLAIHPTNPNVVYVIQVTDHNAGAVGTVFRGDFSAAAPVWTPLTAFPDNFTYPDGSVHKHPYPTTDSGTEHVTAFATKEGGIYIFVSDRSALWVGKGESPASWTRLDDVDLSATGAAIGLKHIDPHSVYLSQDFRLNSDGGRGLIAQVNDGGVQISTDGTNTWTRTNGLTTFSPINVAVNAVRGKAAAITMGTGDNGGFFSADGGKTWITADYQQGDNDAQYSDPAQPSLLYVFAPRGKDVFAPPDEEARLVVYRGTGQPPNAGDGTSDAHRIPGPPARTGGALGWNCVSSSTEIGYRPVVRTLPGKLRKPGGDFIAIRITDTKRYVVRSTVIAKVTAPSDWDSNALRDDPGVKVFRVGNDLPAGDFQILQAAGGHDDTYLYAGDTVTLWKQAPLDPAWQKVVPAAQGPAQAVRFYSDPYRAERIYVLDNAHVWVSTDFANTWKADAKLEAMLTENGAFPFVAPSAGNTLGRTPFEALLQDMAFDPSDAKTIYAAGPAGVFSTSDGVNWKVLVSAASLGTRVMSMFLDTVTDPAIPVIYLATPFRGLLKLTIETPLTFKVFRTSPYPDPFIASANPAAPDVTKPEGKLQKALTDAITAKASDPAHGQVLKTPRDPAAADFNDIFPIPFTIADVTDASKAFPVADYNGNEVDFIASGAKVIVLFAALELRLMVRRFVQELGIQRTSDLLAALNKLAPQIQKAVPLIRDAKDVNGRKVPIDAAQRMPNWSRIFTFDDSSGTVTVDFKGAIAKETTGLDPKSYDFGHSLFHMIVNSGDDTARNCIDAIGYAFMNGALEAGGFFERPGADPKTFRGLWVGGNYAFETIRGEMSVNDGAAQFGGTTRQLAKLMALIRKGTFKDPADPGGDLAWFLLNNAGSGAFPPALQDFTDGKFVYVLNKLGWAQLGRGDPRDNFVASESALIRSTGKNKLYAVAWQNMALHPKGKKFELAKAGTHLLYHQPDIADIIKAAIAAYEA
jgi:hypothetical protein